VGDTIKPLFSWRAAVMGSDLPSTTKLVALALATYMNDRAESAHPGPTRLSRDTSLHVSTVKEKLVELERAGWLLCVARGGAARGSKRMANEYVASVPEPALFALDPSPQTPGRTPDPSPTAPGVHGDPSPSPRRPVAHGDPNTPETSPRRTDTREAFDTDFDEWWTGYPKKVDKARARATYAARRRQGVTPDRLTTARDHYARSVAGVELRYVKHPSVFLHGPDGPWSEWEHGAPAGTGRVDALGAVKAVINR
jgi:hypothetical protein